MKKLNALFALVLMVALLAGCGGDISSPSNQVQGTATAGTIGLNDRIVGTWIRDYDQGIEKVEFTNDGRMVLTYGDGYTEEISYSIEGENQITLS